MHCFLYQKGPKTDLELFLSDTMSIRTTKLVASSAFPFKKMDFTPKSTMQPCTDSQKSAKHCFFVPKCCKFAASTKKHIKPFFAAPTSKGYTKLVTSSRFTFVAMKCTPNEMHTKCTPNVQPSTGCEKLKCTVFGTEKGPKTDTHLFFSDTMSMETTKCVWGNGL